MIVGYYGPIEGDQKEPSAADPLVHNIAAAASLSRCRAIWSRNEAVGCRAADVDEGFRCTQPPMIHPKYSSRLCIAEGVMPT